MKKFLLLGAASLLAVSASALEPKMYSGLQITALSPDGKYLVSEMDGTFTLLNLETGKTVSFEGDPYAANGYSAGQGTTFSKDGVFAGSTPEGAAYFKDNEWHQLVAPTTEFSNYAQGISADGSVIVGITGLAKMSTDDTDVPMQVPAIWERQSDGTYAKGVILPYPDKDFTGRVPQYVTLLCANEDGSRLYGQVQDYSGSMAGLIVYTRKSDGEWEYKYYSDMLNPNKLVFPENPGECPDAPQMEDYMTDEEKAAYQEAVNEATAGNREWPEYSEFATAEELEAYNTALAAWQTVQQEWAARFEAFSAVLYKCMEEGNGLIFNSLKLSPDGKTIVSTVQKSVEDPESMMGFSDIYSPIVINTETGEYSLMPEKNLNATAISADGTIFGFADTGVRTAMVYTPGSTKPITLLEYYKSKNLEAASWMEENMVHDIEGVNPDTWEPIIIEGVECTGCPYITPDLSVIATAVANQWDMNDPSYVFTYVLPGIPASVKGITGDATSVRISSLSGGRLLISGGSSDIEVYDTNGRLLFSAKSATGVIETGLGSGVYVVKAASADSAKALKALF